jgi:hypothetical protein
MRQNRSEQSENSALAAMQERDSPAIQNLIEQLERDLKETQRNASKGK